ncbi:MAG: pepsin/retropepsin-like aspartic protease family protein [Ginsengibacter sp.]
MNKYAIILFLFAFSFTGKESNGMHVLKKLPPKLYFDPIVTSDSVNCIIPFSRAGNLILIKGKADTTEGNFILDTGAPGLVLNLTYFRNYTTNNKEGETGGITGTAAILQTTVDKFFLGPVTWHKAESDLVNLGHIENSKGIKILGLLGMQLFKQFEMIIDYEKSVIYLHLISRKEKGAYKNEMLKDTSAYTMVPVEILENKILMYAWMAGKKLRFIIDTGAESNVLDSRLPNKIFGSVVISRRVILSGSGNKKVEALYGDMKDMKIGNQNYSTLPVLITNLEKMCYSYDTCLDGMLGFDFLSLHKIAFNFVTNKMYIWK